MRVVRRAVMDRFVQHNPKRPDVGLALTNAPPVVPRGHVPLGESDITRLEAAGPSEFPIDDCGSQQHLVVVLTSHPQDVLELEVAVREVQEVHAADVQRKLTERRSDVCQQAEAGDSARRAAATSNATLSEKPLAQVLTCALHQDGHASFSSISSISSERPHVHDRDDQRRSWHSGQCIRDARVPEQPIGVASFDDQGQTA
mmetsp:Transcript_86748/g.265517  ORF Transcript_86748/g.265517 Transcript_86748/m.265517 type:complete len:201 (-) Transcript_86748:336-938(-)